MEIIDARKPLIFCRAFPMAAFDALVRALADHLVFADQAAAKVVAGMTSARTERLMMVLDRGQELYPATWIAAEMARLFAHLSD